MGIITPRKDIGLEELREILKKEKDAKVYRRLLGIIHLLEGGSRKEAEQKAHLSVNVFRNWILRFNKHGIEGLRSIKQTGRPAKISEEVAQDLMKKVLEGPCEEESLVRYRLVDMQEYLKKEHKISIALSGIWEALTDLKLSWKTGRQRHPQSDKAAQDDFKKNLRKASINPKNSS
jgi:transposase